PEHIDHPPEAEVDQQLTEPLFRLVQVPEVAEPPEGSSLEPRLTGIDFPGMQVKDGRPPFRAVDPVDPPSGPAIRKDPEISSACDRQIERAERGGRRRRLQQRPARS